MSGNTSTTALSASAKTRIDKATDQFIAARLPDWLTRASAGQINRLRARFKAHQQSQAQVRAATIGLIPLRKFARLHLQGLINQAAGQAIEELEWLEIRRSFSVPPGIRLPVDQVVKLREPALLRLMQNFHEGASFYEGTGLAAPGSDKVLAGDLDALVKACRQHDAGARYQRLLERVFTPQANANLARDKREGFTLAVEIAALKGDVTAHQQLALQAIAGSEAPSAGLHAYPGLLKVLGHRVTDALMVLLRDERGADAGVVLYLPSDPARALRRFASHEQMNTELAIALKGADYRDYFSQLIALKERPDFLATLDKRLSDPQPDLALDGHAQHDDIFMSLVAQQVRRVKDDARLLLVPTDDADRQASEQRRMRWKAAGLSLANLAGLFIPVVGALLLGQLVVQATVEVYEGVADWLHGHQHEALEHMLGVAETLAVTAALGVGVAVVARGFAASDFVRGLEPVTLDGQGPRLWANDLSAYETAAVDARMQSEGLHGAGEQRWMRVGQRYYEVHRPSPGAGWRLRHPRGGAFGPEVVFNGERGWRLQQERPLECDDPVRMLDSLWPQAKPLDARQVGLVLRSSGMDLDELRGVWVENRALPVNLRDTLELFQADDRVQAFFDHVQEGSIAFTDTDLLRWCQTQPGLEALAGDALREQLLARAPRLRARLLEHLARVEPTDDPLLALVRRDFPKMPERYAQTVLTGCGKAERQLALSEQRLPLTLNIKARALQRLARLNRALIGLSLDSAYDDETGELVFALLTRIPFWPANLNVELFSASGAGRRVAIIGHTDVGNEVVSLMRRDGRFRLYDSEGHERETEIAEPGGIFEAIAALLSPEQQSRMGIVGSDPVAALRDRALDQLPASRKRIEALLGWPEQDPWFNPGQRLANGRVGYALSGHRTRRRSPTRLLRDRLRNLYPSLDDNEIDTQLAKLLEDPRSPYDVLLEREDDLAQLKLHLHRWVQAELNAPRQGARRLIAEQMERAWRLQGEMLHDVDGKPQGMRLSIVAQHVTTLPELPAHVDFPAVTTLVLSELPISHVPSEFLRCFTSVRHLNLGSNRLLQVPSGIGYLVELRRLRLAHNNIRLERNALDVLNGLPHLSNLDLSYNPLGAYYVRYDQLSHLVELNLRHCQLGEWPSSIERCSLLERCDLRDNLLTDVPAEILDMPHVYRRSFLVERNRLSRMDLQRLFALDSIEEHAHLPEERRVIDPARTRELWLPDPHDATSARRAQQWDTLLAMPDSEGLFTLLGRLEDTSDFSQARDYLHARVWALLDALEGNAELRQQVYTLARLPTSCENSVADRFSELQVRLLVDQAERATLHERGNDLLALGKGLFNLEQVERFARQDIAQRLNARERVDQIAVSLFYRVVLRQRLGLPCQPRNMLYADAAQVSGPKVEQALQMVQGAYSPAAFAENLSQRTFWRRYLHERHGQAFADLEQIYRESKALLEAQRTQLTVAQYSLQLESLQIDEASDLQALVLQLTRQLLLGRERGLA